MKSFIRKTYASGSDIRRVERIAREWQRPQKQPKFRPLRGDEITDAAESLKMTWLAH
jgi:hypothetical protein